MIEKTRLKRLLTWLDEPRAFIAMGMEGDFKVWRASTMHRGDYITPAEFGRMESDGLVRQLTKAEGGKYSCHSVISDAGRDVLRRMQRGWLGRWLSSLFWRKSA